MLTFPFPRTHIPSTFVTALVLFLSILGCAVQPSTNRQSLFVPIASLSCYFIFFAKPDNILLHHTQGLCHGINLVVMSDLLLLSPDVQTEFRKKTQQLSSISTASFSDRFKWAIDLYTSYRSNGWEQLSLSSSRASSRATTPDLQELAPATASTPTVDYWKYYHQQAMSLSKILGVYALGDLAIQVNPSFQRGGPPFSAQPWWLQPTVAAHMVVAAAYLDALYWFGSTVTVTLGVCEPSDWLPLFGSFWDAYTVNNFWGRAWHQVLRRSFTVHSRFVVGKINPTNKISRQLLKVFTIFLVSAIMHFISDFTILRKWDAGALAFFMLQPVAIVFELSLSAFCAKSALFRGVWRVIPGWMTRTVGYMWVLTWMSCTLPIRLEPLVEVGAVTDRWHSSITLSLAEQIKLHLNVQ